MQAFALAQAPRLSRSFLLGLLVLVLFAGKVPASGDASGPMLRAVAAKTVTRSYQYAGTADPQQALTATYLPTRHNAPWIVLIHGGSWIDGSRANMSKSVRLFSTHGWQVFNLEYRLKGASYTQQVADVQTATRWVITHAGAFGIDVHRGAVYGFSAGGQLAAVLGMTGPFRAIVTASGVLQPQRVAIDAQGMVPAEPGGPGMQALYAREEQMMGCAYSPGAMSDACALSWYRFEPEHLINPNSPPMLIFQGGADPYVPPASATAFGYWLSVAHVPHTVVIVPGYGHTDIELWDSPVRVNELLHFVLANTR